MKRNMMMAFAMLAIHVNATAGMYFYNNTDKDVIITPCVGGNWMNLDEGSFDRPNVCKTSRLRTLPALKKNKTMTAVGYEGPDSYLIKIGNKEWRLVQNQGNWWVRSENGKDRILGSVQEQDMVIFIADTKGEKPLDMPKPLPGAQAMNPKIMWPDKLRLTE